MKRAASGAARNGQKLTAAAYTSDHHQARFRRKAGCFMGVIIARCSMVSRSVDWGFHGKAEGQIRKLRSSAFSLLGQLRQGYLVLRELRDEHDVALGIEADVRR